MRAMGLDVGTKTIGVAIADELGITAQGIPTIRRVGSRKDVEALRQVVLEYGITHAVVGMPLNMDGSEGPRATASREFAAQLERELQITTELWDERLTTVAAQRALLDGGVSRSKRRQVVDQVAAALILQGWLDARRPPPAYDDEMEDS